MNRLAAFLPTVSGNHWGVGCPKCHYGIVSAPELTGACELYLERLVQAIDGDIVFCDCQAGTRFHVYLKNRFLFLKDEVKKKAQLSAFVGSNTHPDIEQSRRAMSSGYAYVKAPPIRWIDRAEPVTP